LRLIADQGKLMSDIQAVPRKAFTAPWWQIHAWGIGGIASYFMYEQFYLIFNIHTTVFKVNPVLVGWILALPRLFDGLLDPLIGHWSDNMRSRFGRRRPFLLVSAIVGALVASTLFWMEPEWGQWVKGVLLTLSAVTLFTACGTYDMAYTSLGYELSEAYSDRSRVQAIKGVYWSMMGIVGGYVIGLATDTQATGDKIFGGIQDKIGWVESAWRWTTGSIHPWNPVVTNWWQSWRASVGFASEVQGFRVISGIISLLILASVVFPLLWSKERYLKVNRQHVNLWQALRATMRCKPFVLILIINVAKNAGTLPRNLFFFIGVYYVCAGNKATYSNIMGGDFAFYGFLIAIGVWLLTKPLTRLIGKKAAFIAGAGLGLVQAIGTPFVAIPGHIEYWYWFNIAFLPITMVLNTSAAGIMPDICDLDELQYGVRREGMFSAVQAFANKMEISIMMPLSGVFVAWTGFKAELGAAQPQKVLDNMIWMSFTPLIIISAVAFILSCFMPLTRKMMDDVRAQLDARHAAAGVAGFVGFPVVGAPAEGASDADASVEAPPADGPSSGTSA
jgi:GPH family glycoside/pentoside/hexuronide:cation symporter